MRKLVLLLVAISVAVAAYAQDTQQDKYIELLRSDVNTQKVAVITEVMGLTDEQGKIFWPIYREYDTARSKFGDQTIAIIKDYAAHYCTMTDEKAAELMKKVFKMREQELALQKKTCKKIEKELNAVIAARFMQVDSQIGRLIDLQVASELPLIPDTTPTKKTGGSH